MEYPGTDTDIGIGIDNGIEGKMDDLILFSSKKSMNCHPD
jgi:hypothetical protein